VRLGEVGKLPVAEIHPVAASPRWPGRRRAVADHDLRQTALRCWDIPPSDALEADTPELRRIPVYEDVPPHKAMHPFRLVENGMPRQLVVVPTYQKCREILGHKEVQQIARNHKRVVMRPPGLLLYPGIVPIDSVQVTQMQDAHGVLNPGR